MPSGLHPLTFVHFNGLLYYPLIDIWVCPCGVLYNEGFALNSLGASSRVLKLNYPCNFDMGGCIPYAHVENLHADLTFYLSSQKLALCINL